MGSLAFFAVSATSLILDGVNSTIDAILVDELLSRRGNSARWGHHRGSGKYSAEATALATLAGWQQLDASARTSILDYWESHQLSDGGWPSIAPSSSTGNWPTAIIANTLAQVAPNHRSLPKALKSLLSAEPGETFWLWRLKFRTTDTQVRFDPSKYGWGWVPESVSWVIPTAGAILALERGRRLGLIRVREVERRLALGCSMLLDRVCPGGGWNAGNSVVHGRRTCDSHRRDVDRAGRTSFSLSSARSQAIPLLRFVLLICHFNAYPAPGRQANALTPRRSEPGYPSGGCWSLPCFLQGSNGMKTANAGCT